jgi:modulator of FtsH protease
VAAYDPSQWHDLGVAAAGASAALAGLVFVAASINLDRILAYAWLPDRAGETVVLLVAVLVESLLLLAPGQSRIALGAEVLTIGAVGWGLVTAAHVRLRRHTAQVTPAQRRVRVVAGQLASLPAFVAGASLLLHTGGGLYWLLAGITLSVLAAVFNAWVLLIEIAR